MKRYVFFMLTILLAACDSGKEGKLPKEQLVEKIAGLEKSLYNTGGDAPEINRLKATEAVKCYKQFADSFPDDKDVPEYIFKAGEVSIGLNQYQMAIGYYNRIIRYHPDYEKLPEAMYLKAFVYDNYLSYKGMAKEAYQRLIDRFPEHHFAADAQAAINNLGMSDEDLIKMFRQQQDSAKAEG